MRRFLLATGVCVAVLVLGAAGPALADGPHGHGGYMGSYPGGYYYNNGGHHHGGHHGGPWGPYYYNAPQRGYWQGNYGWYGTPNYGRPGVQFDIHVGPPHHGHCW